VSILIAAWEKEICSAKASETKPVWQKPECKEEHIQWLHAILKLKDDPDGKLAEPEKEGAVNMTSGEDGWRTLDESWFNIEAAKDGETFFIIVVLEEDEEDNKEERIKETEGKTECLGPEKE
jgi:hypothetical protein